jgi:uncharacterized protein YneR
MAELESPNNKANETAEAKAAAGRSKDEVALELTKFIAVNAGYGRSAQTAAGFSAKVSGRSPEELADDLLNLFDRCRKAVNKEI